MPRLTPAILAEGLAVGYGGRPVVVGADLLVEPGECVLLLGANGSGKTTLVRSLVGLAEVLGGRLEVAGRRLPGRAHGRVGYVPQRLPATAGVGTTAAELAGTGLLAGRRLGRAGRAGGERVRQALGEIGIAGLARTPVDELSGGQLRRVLIARALVAGPGLVVLDEPSAGVDRAGVVALVDTLATLKSAGRTLLVVTHEAGTFAAVADRSLTMTEGRLVPEAPAAGRLAGVAGSH